MDGTDHVSRAVQTASPSQPHLSPSIASCLSSDGPLCFPHSNLSMTSSQGRPADGNSPVGCLFSASWNPPGPCRPVALTPSSSWRSDTGISDVFPRVEVGSSSSPAPLSSSGGSPISALSSPALRREAVISVHPRQNIPQQRLIPFASEAGSPVADSGYNLANPSRAVSSDWNLRPVCLIGNVSALSYTC